MRKRIYHFPVLQREILKYLEPKKNENFIDATIGEGGHAISILRKTSPKGKVLGIDRDEEILKVLKKRLGKKYKKRLIVVCDNFVNLEKIVKEKRFRKIKGILFDLGMSSWHLEKSKRGFTFQKNEILDMRYDLKNPLTAKEILNKYSEKKIIEILREFGEEKFAKQIAKEIVKEREKNPIETTFQLVEIIKKSVPDWYKRRKIHPATKTFQALRIAVNKELENLKEGLLSAIKILEKGGKIAVISFHSLEDRIAKNIFKQKAKEGTLKIITKKPITPSKKEISNNPRSRSAKLRVVEKI